MSRWDKIETGDIWSSPEGKGEKKSNTKEENKKEKSTSEKGPINLPNISTSKTTTNRLFPSSTNFLPPTQNQPSRLGQFLFGLSQFRLGQILLVFMLIPIIVILVCFTFASIKFFTSTAGGIFSVFFTMGMLLYLHRKGMFPF